MGVDSVSSSPGSALPGEQSLECPGRGWTWAPGPLPTQIVLLGMDFVKVLLMLRPKGVQSDGGCHSGRLGGGQVGEAGAPVQRKGRCSQAMKEAQRWGLPVAGARQQLTPLPKVRSGGKRGAALHGSEWRGVGTHFVSPAETCILKGKDPVPWGSQEPQRIWSLKAAIGVLLPQQRSEGLGAGQTGR